MDRILVCITPQTNSTRLIDRAAEEANLLNGELHILNIQKGDSVFLEPNSAVLLEELFIYGAKKGGMVHALAGKNVPLLIKNFAHKHEITKIIVGEPPENAVNISTGVIGKLKSLCGIETIVLEREKNGGKS